MTDQRLVHDVKSGEGCRLVAYRDTKGFWTIGWGHKLDQSIDWTGQEWTQAMADEMLQHDLDAALEQCHNLPEFGGLNACRSNAVQELVFEMGLHGWLGFENCRRALSRGDWATAQAELLNSAWAREVQPSRRDRLAGYILKGSY